MDTCRAPGRRLLDRRYYKLRSVEPFRGPQYRSARNTSTDFRYPLYSWLFYVRPSSNSIFHPQLCHPSDDWPPDGCRGSFVKSNTNPKMAPYHRILGSNYTVCVILQRTFQFREWF